MRMHGQVTIRVIDVINSTLCVSSEDGTRLHDWLKEHLAAGRRVILSFAGVENLTSAFLNAAIGQLYGEFSEGAIRNCLSIADMGKSDLELLRRVVQTAKNYFSNRQRFDEARREVMGYEDQ